MMPDELNQQPRQRTINQKTKQASKHQKEVTFDAPSTCRFSLTYFEAGVVDSWKAQKKDCHRRDWALQTGPDGRDVPMG